MDTTCNKHHRVYFAEPVIAPNSFLEIVEHKRQGEADGEGGQ